MHKLWASTYKEFLLLVRDLGGIAILFIMPLLLLIVITLVQDSTFRTISDVKIPVLLVDNDKGEISKNIIENLSNSNSFEILQESSEVEAKEAVFAGKYQLAIIIPENLSASLQKKVDQNVEGILSKFGLEENSSSIAKKVIPQQEVRLYFDPATQTSFKSSVKNGIDKMISKIETESIYKAFQNELGEEDSEPIFDTENFIAFKEIFPTKNNVEILPNSAQHNVPAWTLFAIFFIIVPLSINMVKEKNQGTFVRLRTQPINYATVLGGKTIVYLGVCIIQFTLMLLVGMYLFPAIGLPGIDVSGKLPMLYTVALFSGLAAVGLGLMLGTIAKTQEQAAPFGSTLVVILAALGGVWVPVFVMPKLMQFVSMISPMNWGLEAFYDVFLRNVGFVKILPEISLLLLFFLLMLLISIIYNRRKNAV
ncbi:ABC transporter permease [Aequorivita sp. SDUM287046]|uniref:ABC transporter permease n=1 Tax=Aequorivita aurantiaca TaxID=3053356 RepID=A0ABT8DJM6_9FLAO|nr:ABC transporter permease [Aequorivita aurantiaca]MDN3723335.1 ABC transporter permease [Aequorivita aurantiaca]